MIPAFLPTCLPPCLPGRVPARPISVCPHPPRLLPTRCSPRTPPGPVLRRPLSDARPTLPTPSLLHAAPCPREDVPLEELPREHVPLEAGPCGDVPLEQELPREDVRRKDVPREDIPREELSREDVPLETGRPQTARRRT